MTPHVLTGGKDVAVMPDEDDMPHLRKNYDETDEDGLVHGA